MELMGKSLQKLLSLLPKKKMSIRCVCNIGYQMIQILKFIHDKNIIYRDIKPDNFVIGKNEKKKYIYLLDFGLAKKYRSSKTLKHYEMKQKRKLTGTARYASINALSGFEQSRRDDLEAVGYVLMYFLKGSLPWQGLPIKNKDDKYGNILLKKKETSPEELCNGFPKEFEYYIKYTRELKYEEDPNYLYLENLFIDVLKKMDFQLDYYYDWIGYEEEEKSEGDIYINNNYNNNIISDDNNNNNNDNNNDNNYNYKNNEKNDKNNFRGNNNKNDVNNENNNYNVNNDNKLDEIENFDKNDIVNNNIENENKRNEDKIIDEQQNNYEEKDNVIELFGKKIKIIDNIEQKIVNYETNSNSENDKITNNINNNNNLNKNNNLNNNNLNNNNNFNNNNNNNINNNHYKTKNEITEVLENTKDKRQKKESIGCCSIM